MKAVSQTGSPLSVPPVLLPQPPETTLTHGHEAPLADRSPRPAAPDQSVRRGLLEAVPFGLFSRHRQYKNLTPIRPPMSRGQTDAARGGGVVVRETNSESSGPRVCG